jgi:hypothetical protein
VASIGLAFVMLGAWRTLLPAGLCFGVTCALTNPIAAPFHLSPTCSVERDNYLLVTDVTRWLASEGWHVNTRSWYPPSDLLARPDGCGDYELVRTFQAIEQAGMLWKINLQLPARIADLSQYEVRNIAEKPRAHLVIFSQPEKAETYNRELAEWGRTSGVNPVPRPAEKRTFRHGSLSVTVQVYRLRQPQRS